MKRLHRPYLIPNGNILHNYIEVCKCKDDQRGNKGGCCGCCGGAIPTDEEIRNDIDSNYDYFWGNPWVPPY